MPPPRRLSRDDRGASPLVAFLVAGALFGVLAFGLAATHATLRPASADNARLSALAGGALGLLLDSEGVPPKWGDSDAAADDVARLGLLAGPNTVRVGEGKLLRFQGAGLTAEPNGKVDYASARLALGLAGHQFHLRTMPVFDPHAGTYYGVEGIETTRVGYIGDYSSDGAVEGPPSLAESAVLDAFPVAHDNVRFLPSTGGDKYPDHKATVERHLVLRLAGWLRTEHLVTQNDAGATTWHLLDRAHLPAGAARDGAGGGRVVAVGTPTSVAYGALENDRLVSPPVDVRGMSQPRLTFREYVDGDCALLLGICVAPLDYATVEVSRDGLVWTPLPSAQPSWTSGGAWRTRSFDLAGCLPCAMGPVHVGFRWTSDGTTHRVGWIVDDVAVTDATGARAWSNANEFATSHYRVLIVGSDVDQNGLNEDTIKFRLRDWVLAGGNLYVMGSTAKQDNWMQPIFGAGLGAGAATAPHAPDPTHPILATPNALAYAGYPSAGGVWQIGQAHQTKFAQVVGADPPSSPPARDDILSVSYPNAYNNGTVILTTYLPYQMSADEASKLFANFLMYGRYGVLYLDYGVPVPDGVPVGAATRLTLAPKTIDPVGPRLEMLVTVQVWPG